MGKTEKGAVWLDPKLMSAYDFYQYWVNVQDDDAIRFLKLYTFLSMEDIKPYESLKGADIREAKQRLALEITTLVHGKEEAEKSQVAARKVFSGGHSADMPKCSTSLPMAFGDLLVAAGLAPSKSQARRLIKGNAIKMDYGNGKIAITNHETLCDQEGNLWAGKKRCVKIIKES